MTIATQSALAGPFTGNGSTTVFAFTFKCFDQTDLQIIREQSDVQTVLTLTTDYSVTLNADQEASPGGSVTMITAPTSAQTIFIVSDVDYTQEAAFTNAGGFYPNVLNDARDRTTLQIQQLNDKIARAPLVPVGDTASGDLLTSVQAAVDNIDAIKAAPTKATEAAASAAATAADRTAVADDRAAVEAIESDLEDTSDTIAFLETAFSQGFRLSSTEADLVSITQTSSQRAVLRWDGEKTERFRDGEWFELADAGTVEALSGNVRQGFRLSASEQDIIKVFVTSNNRKVAELDEEGTLGGADAKAPIATSFSDGSTTGVIAPSEPDTNFVSVSLGQSLSVGVGNTVSAITTTAENATTSRMIQPATASHAIGPIVTNAAFTGAALVPLVSAASGNQGETHIPGMARSIADFEQSEFGNKYSWIFGSVGVSGQSYEELRSYLDRLVAFLSAAKSLSADEGRAAVVKNVNIILGESNRAQGDSGDRYIAMMQQYADEIIAIVKQVMGQDFEPKIVVTQTAAAATGATYRPDLADGQRRLVDIDRRFVFGGPHYQYPVNEDAGDSTHHSSLGYRFFGEYLGHFGVAPAVYGFPAPAPRPLRIQKTGAREIQATFEYEMKLDTGGTVINATGPGLYGIEIDDGGTRVTPSAITFSEETTAGQGKTVIIATSADLTGPYIDLHIAGRATGSDSMNVTGARSCLYAVDYSLTGTNDNTYTHRLWACHSVGEVQC